MKGILLRFYVHENRKHHHILLYEWLLEQARRMDATPPIVHALLAHAYAKAGRITDAQKESNVLNTIARSRYVPPSYFAIVSIALGDQNQAFAYLNKSYQDRSEQMLYLGVEPLVDPLRRDPRFEYASDRLTAIRRFSSNVVSDRSSRL